MPTHLTTIFTGEIANYFGVSNIDHLEIFHHCAELALQYFSNNPHEPKITRDQWCTLFPQAPQSPCSFLNNKNDANPNQGIYALSRAELGKGAYGKVKWGLRLDQPDQRLFTIKIQIPTNKIELNALAAEEAIGLSRKFFTETKLTRLTAGKNKEDKYYLISPYAGITLKTWLKHPQSNQALIRVAIDLLLETDLMHTGSQDCKPFVHRDLKLANTVILDGKISIIDYGNACHDTSLPARELVGTPWCLPYFPTPVSKLTKEARQLLINNIHRLGKYGVDCFAVWRMLYMPFSAKDFEPSSIPPSILGGMLAALPTQIFRMIDSTNIKAAIETIVNKIVTLKLTAAHLILFYYGTYSDDIPLQLSTAFQQKIIELYQNQNLSEHQKRESIISMQRHSLTPLSSVDSLSTPDVSYPGVFFKQSAENAFVPSAYFQAERI